MLSQQNLRPWAGARSRQAAKAVVQMGKNSWHRAAHLNAFGVFFFFLILQPAVWTLHFTQKIRTAVHLLPWNFSGATSIWNDPEIQVTKPQLAATKLLSNTIKSSLELIPDRTLSCQGRHTLRRPWVTHAGAGTPQGTPQGRGCPTPGQGQRHGGVEENGQ